MYIVMETGYEYEYLIKLPITVFNRICESIGKIYKEKNKIQEAATNGNT